MLVTKIVGNIHHTEKEHQNMDVIELDWEELNKRILRKKTLSGRDVSISLEDGQALEVGDILYEDEQVQIVIQTKKEDAYIIYPKNMIEMGKVSFELGNRHTPCLIEVDQILVRYDYTLEKLLDEVGVDYERGERRFPKAFQYKKHHHHH